VAGVGTGRLETLRPAGPRKERTVHLDPKHLEAVRKGDALSFGLKLQRGP